MATCANVQQEEESWGFTYDDMQAHTLGEGVHDELVELIVHYHATLDVSASQDLGYGYRASHRELNKQLSRMAYVLCSLARSKDLALEKRSHASRCGGRNGRRAIPF